MLLPVYTYERQPLGIFPVLDGTTVEGGNVGEIVQGPSTQDDLPVINLFNPGAGDGYGDDAGTDLNLIGLIDESSTGTKYSGEGNTGQIGKLVEHPFDTSGTHIGPSSMFGSGKATLWISEGIYLTDQFNGATTSTTVGTDLFASSAGVLTTTTNGSAVGQVLKVFQGGIDNVTVRELLGTLPRVQPLPTDTSLLLFKFK